MHNLQAGVGQKGKVHADQTAFRDNANSQVDSP